jgi:hypothetical protein
MQVVPFVGKVDKDFEEKGECQTSLKVHSTK